MQLLVVPTPRFSARFAADIQPRGSETTNGRTINLPTPTSYANGTPTNLTTDPSTRLARRWFTQNSTYSYAGNYLYGGADGKSVANDAARGLVTGSKGVSAELNWTLGEHTLTSITAYKTYHFNAVNDEGTPFDIQRNSGGFFNDYTQVSEEVRVSSPRGRFARLPGRAVLHRRQERRGLPEDLGPRRRRVVRQPHAVRAARRRSRWAATCCSSRWTG